MNNLRVLLICCITALLATHCANQKPPTGGPKDEDPPVLISSTPAHESLNFDDKKIELTFNEAVQLKNAKEQIIITPRVQGEYDIKFKKDKVIIEFEDPLKDSTTYTFNFREGIQDLNEGNPAENLKLAFSTGSLLDSLQINGKVKNIMTNQFVEDVTVSLYETADTLTPLLDPPVYFTKTNAEGYYQFDNLKAGNYKLIAVADDNKNLFIDPKKESYGFIRDTLYLTSNIDSLEIGIQHLDIRPISFQGARQSGTTYDLKFNKYLTTYSLKAEDSIPLISNFSSNEHNTIQIFNTSFQQDSLFTIVEAYDSVFNHLVDTVYVKFEPTNRKPSELTVSKKLETIIPSDGILKGTFTFSKPITQVYYDSAFIFIDSLHILSIDSTHLIANQHADQFDLTYTFDQSLFAPKSENATISKTTKRDKKLSAPDSLTSSQSDSITQLKADTTRTNASTKSQQKVNPYIYFARNSFISIEQDSSKTIKQELSFKKASDFAILQVEIQPSNNQYFIVQLLDKQYKVVQEVSNQNKFSFEHIPPGDYRLRVLVDENRNGKWDTGNFITGETHEPVVYFVNSENQELLTFRANWEVGPYIISF